MTFFGDNQETSLSEKIEGTLTPYQWLYLKDVKEFIKKLKSALCAEMFQRPTIKPSMLDRIPQTKIMETINKLAGKDLI